MNWHPNIVAQIVLGLKDILENERSAEGVVSRILIANKKWGSRDRRYLANTLYEMLRWWILLGCIDENGDQIVGDDKYYLRWAVFEIWKNSGIAEEINKKMVGKVQVDESLQNRISIFSTESLEAYQKLSVSPWLLSKIQAQHADALDLMASLNEMGTVFLRVNTLKTEPRDLVERLKHRGFNVVYDSKTCLKLLERKNIEGTQEYKDGLFEVQDRGSQKISEYLNPNSSDLVVDFCAGAGGKSLHLAALMGDRGKIVSSDISTGKLERLQARTDRAGARSIEVLDLPSLFNKYAGKADKVLIDAPCSGTGIIRRSPMTKYSLNDEKLQKIVKLQREIMLEAITLLKRGGVLVYATCSILREENEDQMDWLLSENPNFKVDGEALKINPKSGSDGFRAFRLRLKN